MGSIGAECFGMFPGQPGPGILSCEVELPLNPGGCMDFEVHTFVGEFAPPIITNCAESASSSDDAYPTNNWVLRANRNHRRTAINGKLSVRLLDQGLPSRLLLDWLAVVY